MTLLKNLILILSMTVLLVSCKSGSFTSGCPDGEIEWVDMVMIQDIKYQHHFPNPADANSSISIERGKELGKVSYKMADRACSNHKMKNGDAAYIEKGTPIYEIKGYPTSLMVVVNDKVYVADTNLKAKTAGVLYPMDKLVKNIYFESTEDGSRIHTFSEASKNKFIKAWYQLKLEDVDSLIKEGKLEGNRVFLEIEFQNGVTFRQLYWYDTNIFHNGAIGNNEIKEIIDFELSN
jgi:hypothetical protein